MTRINRTVRARAECTRVHMLIGGSAGELRVNGTRAQTVVCRTIRALGLMARYSTVLDEYQINYVRTDPRHTEDTAYYTSDPDDAIMTAQAMAGARS